MGNAMFYHLTRSPAEQLLPTLIGKSRQAGWRVELRGTDAARMARLDEALWQGDGFLPHGLAGGPHDALQPVLLTVGGAGDAGKGAGADCLIALDGAAVDPAECAPAQRVCIVFDGNDPTALDTARGQWRSLTGAGVAAEYWSEEGGRWERKR
ncbi:DNA polymerase III subunit chi [Paracoccus sphaerophysae]|uniref:DNA polymerase III subunit chi n=1 Tax=Paracoccus sphaerophysae TaxID=690417 RepID=A0A099FD96_9RHOB|nr:DNA polymerase III subunit chi [Paracoccus sphaerophysae]KGJ08735.1 DNA polymerase III subunit chi [Paracoccus sphaerophysae]